MKSKKTVAVALILFVVAFSGDANAKLKAARERGEIEVQTCKISIAPNARGEITRPKEENNYKFAGYSETFESKGISQRFGFSIGCVDRITDRNDVAKEHGGYFDPEKKAWVAYYVDEQDKDSLAPATHIYAIHTSNASGFARTTDDVIGDPRQRARALSYCLFHDAKAICGEGQVMNLSDQKANFLPTALKILRSVEFVDVKPNDRSALGRHGYGGTGRQINSQKLAGSAPHPGRQLIAPSAWTEAQPSRALSKCHARRIDISEGLCSGIVGHATCLSTRADLPLGALIGLPLSVQMVPLHLILQGFAYSRIGL